MQDRKALITAWNYTPSIMGVFAFCWFYWAKSHAERRDIYVYWQRYNASQVVLVVSMEGRFVRHSAYLSTFIGRKEEVAEIKTRMRERSVRLLTLTGPGGCGKTRLAYEALSFISENFEDGIAWVDLVGLSTANDLLLETASALDIRPGPGQTLLAALIAALQQRETLLVLDNCEHLIDACAQMVNALLRACPELHFLATSRQKLGVEGEQAWPVPPLSYPEKDISSIKSMGDYDAVQLFMERSCLVDPGFEIDARNFSALVKVTRLLEGMPLAIELAAARVS